MQTSILSTVIVGGIVLAIVGTVIYFMVRKPKNGQKRGCCGCEHASSCGHSLPENKQS